MTGSNSWKILTVGITALSVAVGSFMYFFNNENETEEMTSNENHNPTQELNKNNHDITKINNLKNGNGNVKQQNNSIKNAEEIKIINKELNQPSNNLDNNMIADKSNTPKKSLVATNKESFKEKDSQIYLSNNNAMKRESPSPNSERDEKKMKISSELLNEWVLVENNVSNCDTFSKKSNASEILINDCEVRGIYDLTKYDLTTLWSDKIFDAKQVTYISSQQSMIKFELNDTEQNVENRNHLNIISKIKLNFAPELQCKDVVPDMKGIYILRLLCNFY